jgi:hypothetical protein
MNTQMSKVMVVSDQGKQKFSSCPVLPMDVVNLIMLFREAHPVAKLIQDLKKKFNLCVVCMEKPRYKTSECCSSICNHQMGDDPWFNYPTFDGQQFDRYLHEKYANGKWLEWWEEEEHQ